MHVGRAAFALVVLMILAGIPAPAAALSLAAPATWIRVNSPATSDYQDVTYAGATNAWIAGTNGVVLKSTDGGVSFSQVDVGSNQAFYSVAFAGSQYGYVAGGGGTVRRTFDGGLTWSGGTTGFGDDLGGLSFPTARTGYVGGKGGAILKTTDCGRTWTRQNSGFDSDIVNTYFLDENRGWAVGNRGIILATTNGGATWVRQKEPATDFDSLNSIFFFDAITGWATGDPSPTTGGGFRSNLWKTTNGGATWNRIELGANFAGPQISGVKFVSLTQGFLSAEEGFALSSNDGGATIIIENSGLGRGGDNWLLAVDARADLSALMVGQGSKIIRRPATPITRIAAQDRFLYIPQVQTPTRTNPDAVCDNI